MQTVVRARVFALFVVLATCLLADGRLRAGETGDVKPVAEAEPPAEFPEDFSDGLLDRDAVLENAAKLSRETYPNSDTVLVDKHVWVRYRADGTFVQWDDNYVKVLTEKGKRDWQTIQSWYTQPYNTTHFKQVEIIKPDGKAVPIDIQALSRDMAEPSQMEKNITNPRNRIVSVSVPGLEVGDVVHYVMVDYFTKTRVPDTFSDFIGMESTRPIKRMVYELHGPKERPLASVVLKDEVEGTVAHATGEKNGGFFHRWEVRDVPRMFPEPSMPAPYTVNQRLIISTTPDWKTLSRWYWNLSKPHLETTPAIREKVAEIIQDVEEKRKQIDAIFYWVSQNVRYVGITPEEEAPGYEPHDVSMTFEQRHGVCRDKAALLVAMLREAGFESYPVLIHNGPKKDIEVPTPYFNHAVVAARDEDGSWILMDPTDENTRQLFPSYLDNQSFLVATPEGETLQTSPTVPAEENLMEIRTTGTVTAEGDLHAESELIFNGINDNIYRGYFSHIPPEVRRRLFEGRVKDAAPGARLVGYEIEPLDMRDVSKTLRVRLRFDASDVLVRGDGVTLLPLPRLGTGIGWVNFVLDSTGLKERQYPLLTKTACGVLETITLELAPELGKVVSVPEYAKVESDTISLHSTVKANAAEPGVPGVLQGESRFLLKAVEWSPRQYQDLKETLKAMEYDSRKRVILSATESAATLDTASAESVVESETVRYELKDAHNWTETRTVRRRILTAAGKKWYSDIQIRYNPAWETVTLERAVSELADGSRKEIDKTAINLMDAPWIGAAPRYPAGKILVANLPGVEVGSVIETVIRTEHRNKPFFAMTEYFRSWDPIASKTVTWVGPNGVVRSIQPDTTGTVHVGKQIEDGVLTYTWTAKNVPGIKREDRTPPPYAFAPTVGLSTGDWAEYAKATGEALLALTRDQEKAAAKAKELVQGLEDDAAKLTAIRDFVEKAVRRAGPAFTELPLGELSGADVTLGDGYGNAADRAILYYTMTEAVGFKPEFMVVSTISRVPQLKRLLLDHPSTDWLGQMLVRLRLGEGHVYLGDTDQYDVLGSTHSEGRSGLLLPRGGFYPIQALAEREARMLTRYTIKLDAEGGAEITREEKLYGTFHGRQRQRFEEMPPEDRKRWFLEAMARVSQAATAVGELETDFLSYPAVVRYTMRIPQFAVRDGENLYFELPEDLQYFLRMRGDTRENPIYMGDRIRRRLQFEIHPPEGFSEALLVPADVESWFPGIRAFIKSRREGQVIQIDQEVAIDPLLVPARQYDKLLELDRNMSHPSARILLLRKGGE